LNPDPTAPAAPSAAEDRIHFSATLNPGAAGSVLVDAMPFGRLLVREHRAGAVAPAADIPAAAQPGITVDGERLALDAAPDSASPVASYSASGHRQLVAEWQPGPAFNAEASALITVRVQARVQLGVTLHGSGQGTWDLHGQLLGNNFRFEGAAGADGTAWISDDFGRRTRSGSASRGGGERLLRSRAFQAAERFHLDADHLVSESLNAEASIYATLAGGPDGRARIRLALATDWVLEVAIESRGLAVR
jgi:hypothetical protein